MRMRMRLLPGRRALPLLQAEVRSRAGCKTTRQDGAKAGLTISSALIFKKRLAQRFSFPNSRELGNKSKIKNNKPALLSGGEKITANRRTPCSPQAAAGFYQESARLFSEKYSGPRSLAQSPSTRHRTWQGIPAPPQCGS